VGDQHRGKRQHEIERAGPLEAVPQPLAGSRVRVGRAEDDVVEVGLALDERERQPVRELEAVTTARDAQADPLQHPTLTRPLRLEERQLPAAGVPADQREPVGPLDHVHAEPGNRDVGDHVALRRPERDVIE